MMTTPTKFQVHMTLYTNMTPEVPVKKSSLNDDYTHEVSSPYDPYTNMFPPPRPQMTPTLQDVEMLTPTKFHHHGT